MELSSLTRVIEPILSRKLYMMAKEYDNVIDFTIGDPDVPTPKGICNAANIAISKGLTRYTPNLGISSLRNSISSYYNNRFGSRFSSDEVIVGIGATEIIYLALMSLIDKTNEVLIIAPYWKQYENITLLCGGRPIILNPENGVQPTIEEVTRHINPKTRLIIINTPNNPTGHIYSDVFLKSLAEIAVSNNVIILSDEVYAELSYNKFTSLAKYCPKEYIIIVSGASKAFAMTGWRIGYALTSVSLVSAMMTLHQNIAICAPAISQYAALEAYNNAEYYSNIIVKEFSKRKSVLQTELHSIKSLSAMPIDGTFYSWIDISSTGRKSLDFTYSLLKKEQVAVIPGLAFGEEYDNHIRIAFTLETKSITEGIARIKKFIEND